MSQEETRPLRHVPTAACTRCGATVDPERFQYALRDSTPADEKGTVESGNLCEERFNDVLTVVREDVNIN
jgi:hypothetical protein